MTIEILAQSIAQLGSLTESVGGRLAVAVTDTRELWIVDLSVAGGRWIKDGDADCTLVVTSAALSSFGDPDALRHRIESGEVAVMGAIEKLQRLTKLIDDGPGWVARIAA
jgi:predicted ATP-dependent serine protease